MTQNEQEKIEELLSRGVAEVIDYDHLKDRLLSGDTLTIKLGIDPTSPHLHLGRAVLLLKLRDFQELGHRIVFIIGDFTGTIGDTSDKESERPMLSAEEVAQNMETYVAQASKILDMEKTEIRHNSEWLSNLTYAEIGEHANQFSVSDFISRDNIKKRLTDGSRVSLREVLYPLMQGYDSVAVEADVEIGGTDQRFNILAGRTLQEHYGKEPQDIVMTNLILGTDGRKMSSSWGNTVNLQDEPNEMFGKVMSIPDDLILSYFIHCTRVPMERINEYDEALVDEHTNPRDIKLTLAFEITKLYWGEEKAREAQEYFGTVFTKKEKPEEMPEFPIAGETLLDVLVESGLAKSKSDARRVIEQQGVKINDTAIDDPDYIVTEGSILQKGKRHFAKIV